MTSLPRLLAGLLLSGAALAAPLAAKAQTPMPLQAPAPAAPQPAAFDLAPAPAAPAAVAPASAASPTLRRFGTAGLAFDIAGETGTATVPFFVTAEETARPGRLVLSVASAVSIAPETSNFQVFVNDVPVASTRLGSDTRLDVVLPSGLLQPGFNAVRIAATQHHRVDCSIGATYELWTRVDPAASGVDFGLAQTRLAGLSDLPALGRTDGRPLVVRGILRPEASAQEIEDVIAAVQATILLGRFQGASVEFGSERGTGPGIDVAAAPTASLAALGLAAPANTAVPNVALAAGPGDGRALLTVGGSNAADMRAALDVLVGEARRPEAAGTAAGLQALANGEGQALEGRDVVSLADLGFVSEEFAGRLYRSQIGFSLPADFYAADYADASLVLDAAYAAGLGRDARLIVRANGREVSSLPLSSTRSGRIENQALRIPLGSLKPGENVLSFEANLAKDSDLACDPTAEASPPVRFAISDTTELKLPRLARIGHLPDLAALASGGLHASEARARTTLLAPGLDREAIGAATTVLSRVAMADGGVQRVRLLSEMPAMVEGNLVAAGTYAALPSTLLEAVRLDPFRPSEAAASAPAETGLVSIAANAASVPSTLLSAFTEEGGIRDGVMEFVAPAARPVMEAFGWTGESFGGLPEPEAISPRADTLLTLVQAAAQGTEPAAWTVIAAPDAAALKSGAHALVGAGVWPQVGGAATLLSREGGITAIAPDGERLFQTQPLSFENGRYVLASWFSRHSQNYLAALMILGLALALTTRFFLRSIGESGK